MQFGKKNEGYSFGSTGMLTAL